MTPEDIAAGMTGRLKLVQPGRWEALLPSACVQNHASFLSRTADALHCLWFGGSLEGKADISIWRSTLHDTQWSQAEKLTDDAQRSEQNPVLFNAPDGRCLLFNTAQPGGNQDECAVRMSETDCAPRDLPLPKGTFVRGPVQVRHDGAWLLPLFRCVQRPGARWTGSHDTAALAISIDHGKHWQEVDVPGSIGCVHMTLVKGQPTGYGAVVAAHEKPYIAYFRRRQADFVHRAQSIDGGETWSVPEPTDVPNNNSSISAIRLHDGRIALACNPVNARMYPLARRSGLYDELGDHDRRPQSKGGCEPIWGVPRAPMTICLSNDDGRSFPHRLVIEEGDGACLSNNSLNGQNHELSYPSLLEGADGSIDLAYTCHRRAIRHVRLDRDWMQH